MDNVPVRTNDAGPARRGASEHHDGSGSKKPKKNRLKLIAISAAAVIIIGLVVLASLFVYRASTGSTIDSTKFQAVFFTNGQVYFGRLQTLNDSYMKLTDIFYLQTKSALDPGNPQSTSDQTAADVELVKLGQEVHGPEDAMIINKDQLLFFENLRPDGRVSQSILNFKSQ